ncbi:ENR1 protein, partial [Rhinopomastus cyanomelas]|nr:ENR1 protein [Rhinopomastus cyanomelas]NXN99332.1 ENR1 protein [Rhinopomastus cyanomelas]
HNIIKLFNCSKEVQNPYESIPEISQFWNNLANTQAGFWKAPDGLFWICGKRASSELPPDWRGRCTLGIIQPELGVPLYESLKRSKRN